MNWEKVAQQAKDEAKDDGRNPFGECESGHQYFRGGCPSCGADMMARYQ